MEERRPELTGEAKGVPDREKEEEVMADWEEEERNEGKSVKNQKSQVLEWQIYKFMF